MTIRSSKPKEKSLEIKRITVREPVFVDSEAARTNLRDLLANILGVKPVSIEMKFEDRSQEPPVDYKFKDGL